MELTQKTFAKRLEDLRTLIREKPEEFEKLGQSMHEKGVECAIIIPLLEVILEFDTTCDVQYEKLSDSKNGQRFDFLIENRLLVEAKALSANLDEHYGQLEKYIEGNNDIDCGLLTNGVDFQVWIQKSFLEHESGKKLPHAPHVARVLEVSLDTDADTVQFVLASLALFSKSKYQQSLSTIARIAGFYAVGGKGKPPILAEDKEIDKILKDRIRAAMSIQKGVYYDDVVSGKLKAGEKLQYRNECVEVTVEVMETGTVKLRKGCANVLNMVSAMQKGWRPMVKVIEEEWSQDDREFKDPLEIIKIALNKQKLFNRGNYKFRPVV